MKKIEQKTIFKMNLSRSQEEGDAPFKHSELFVMSIVRKVVNLFLQSVYQSVCLEIRAIRKWRWIDHTGLIPATLLERIPVFLPSVFLFFFSCCKPFDHLLGLFFKLDCFLTDFLILN